MATQRLKDTCTTMYSCFQKPGSNDMENKKSTTGTDNTDGYAEIETEKENKIESNIEVKTGQIKKRSSMCTGADGGVTANKRMKANNNSNEKVQFTYDFYIIMEEDEKFERKVMKIIQDKAPDVVCLCSNDGKSGEFPRKNCANAVKASKIVVVVFSTQETTSIPEYVANTTLANMKKRKNKLVLFKMSKDTVIPEYLEEIPCIEYYKAHFEDKLLGILRKHDTGGPVNIDASELKMLTDGKLYEWKTSTSKAVTVSISSTPMVTENLNHLMHLHHSNVESFSYYTFIEQDLKAVYLSLPGYHTLKDCTEPGFLSKYNKQKAVIGATRGLVFLHQNRIKHGNLNTSTVVVDRRGHAKLQEFGFMKTSVPERDDWVGWLKYLAPDIDGLAAVAFFLLTEKEIKHRAQYEIPGFKSVTLTTRFFSACLGDAEKKPPALEAFFWFHGFFGMAAPKTRDQKCQPFRVKKKIRKIRCQSCGKYIEEELAITHQEVVTVGHLRIPKPSDVHYCAVIRCIQKKNITFDGRVVYDNISKPIITINDIEKLKNRNFLYQYY